MLESRTSHLPFDIIPLGVNFSNLSHKHEMTSKHNTNPTSLPMFDALLHDIPFNFDTITTRTGSRVQERRGTAWIVNNKNIGSLAYSGKLMNPHPMPQSVERIMHSLEQSILLDAEYHYPTNPQYHDHHQYDSLFDCALCNHYPDNDAACKFHTDPEHGTFWERLTCVVSTGKERRFAFRPIPDETNWSLWDHQAVENKVFTKPHNDKIHSSKPIINNADITPAVILLFSGDIVKMWGSCNDLFHHAVYTAEDDGNESIFGGEAEGRISLVFKKAIKRGNGRLGHGKMGEGRRSKHHKSRNLTR
mmetsp:Transcript_1293/g.1859  ORF Transcript_1293/g.1859 Transcript_1293/m.1859 type:complete len:304 (-) Transcript_1293:100-1011(-)